MTPLEKAGLNIWPTDDAIERLGAGRDRRFGGHPEESVSIALSSYVVREKDAPANGFLE